MSGNDWTDAICGVIIYGGIVCIVMFIFSDILIRLTKKKSVKPKRQHPIMPVQPPSYIQPPGFGYPQYPPQPPMIQGPGYQQAPNQPMIPPQNGWNRYNNQ